MKLFQKDSPWIRLIDNMGNLVLLNLMFVLFCLPVVTIPAAVTALYSCTLCMSRREELELSRFRRVFREEFLMSLKAGLVIAVLTALLVLDWRFMSANPNLPSILRYLLYVLCFLTACIALYTFPLISRFEGTLKGYIRLSLALASQNMPQTLLMLLASALPAILYWYNSGLALRLTIIWLLFGFALTAYFNAGLLRTAFWQLEARAAAAENAGEAEEAAVTDGSEDAEESE